MQRFCKLDTLGNSGRPGHANSFLKYSIDITNLLFWVPSTWLAMTSKTGYDQLVDNFDDNLYAENYIYPSPLS